jgi:hypothetical protein
VTPVAKRDGGRAVRRSYQQRVESQLAQIRERVRELQLLRTYGLRGPALAEHKRELEQARQQLANLVVHHGVG